MANRKFPEHIFVAHGEDGDSTWLNANEEAINAIDDDGPTRIATYRLVEVNELSKRVVSKPVK